MNVRKWLYLFFTTLAMGGVVGGLFGLLFNWDKITGGGWVNLLMGVIWLIGFGLLFSAISQMGYFAYLTVHRFGLGMFGGAFLWNRILAVLTALVLFDLLFFRHKNIAVGYYLSPLILLVFGGVVAYVKMKETNRHAFFPTLFVMVVVTTIEWYFTLKTNDPHWMWTVLAVLLVCNAWQVLILHRLLDTRKRTVTS